MNTIFFPPINYFPSLGDRDAMTVNELCKAAGIPCRASGEWINRLVSWQEGGEMKIFAEPGHQGSVHIVLPSSAKDNLQHVARKLLVVMAYGVFDGVARESVRGVPWARQVTPIGRPKLPRAKTAAERQRAWRARQEKGKIRSKVSVP